MSANVRVSGVIGESPVMGFSQFITGTFMKFVIKHLVFKAACLAVAFFSSPAVVQAEVIPIEPIEKGFFISSEPSMTMYWQGKDSKAVLIFIPGGEGYIGLKPGQTDSRSSFSQMLKRLTNSELTSGKFDVVLLDSPSELSPRQPYPSARGSSDHLIRIESAIRYYKEKTGLPIWLMGHSNGGISLTEFIKYMQKQNKADLIAGMIASGIRSESYFNAPLDIPVLFMHHKQDGCSHTMPNVSYLNYTKVKDFNKSATEFAYVTGGEPESKDPCRSGFHMYYGASAEAAKIIDAFMSKNYK
jgi:hypothetical protein